MKAKKRVILVVDDEEPIRALYRSELEDAGYSVITAADGSGALEAIGRQHPDLVTLDIRMPDMDGIEVLRRIRETDKALPVILSTAYGEYRQNFHTWSSDACLVKSSDLTCLKDTIRRLLER